MRRLSAIPALILVLAAGIIARGQTTFTWTGNGADSNFSTGGNWVGGVAPSVGSNLQFGNITDPSLQNVTVNGSQTVGNISFTGIRNGYYLNLPFTGSPVLTVGGNISTDTASIYWGVFGVPVVLTAGSHTFSTGSAELYFFNTLGGTGSVVKTGASNLILTTDNSGWTGGLTINQGNVYVSDDHALGTGTVTLNGGTLAATGNYGANPTLVTLANNFLVGANPVFGTANFPSPVPLALTGTIAPIAGVSAVNFDLNHTQTLYLKGALIDGTPAPTSYSFSNGVYVSSGLNNYTGSTTINSGSTLTFDGTASVQNLAPQSITTSTGGYVGLGSNAALTDVSGFLAKLNPTNFAGTVGFDTLTNSSPFKGAIDLSGFTTPGVSIGTQTTATLYGPITPQSSGGYSFAGHGTLFLGDEASQPSYGLGGASSLSVNVTPNDGKTFLLVLGRSSANTYTGTTAISANSGVVLDTPGSLPVGSPKITLGTGAYLGATDTSGLTSATLASQLQSVNPNSVIGFDSHNILFNLSSAPVTVNNLDLSAVSSPFYIGTATGATLTGTLQTANGNSADYYFSGFGSGQLQIDSALTGNKVLNVGLTGATQTAGVDLPSVLLTNVANTYSGGTVLNSGRLILTDSRVLGTGGLTVNATASDERADLGTVASSVTISAPIVLQNGELHLSPSNALALTGDISGPGGISFGATSNSLTLSGHNSYSGGTVLDNEAAVTATTDTAFGTGSLELRNASTVNFTSAAPVIGDLLNGSLDLNYVPSSLTLGASGPATLTINQSTNATFDGDIRQAGSFAVSVVKAGSATLVFSSANNNYSGGTTINAGKLIASTASSVGTGTVTINGGSFAAGNGVVFTNPIVFGPSGGVLSGDGVFNAHITAGTNVVLSPGNSPGILTFNSGLALASGGSIIMEIESAAGAAGTGYDTVDVAGGALDVTATAGAPFQIKLVSLNLSGTAGNVADFSGSTGYSWMLYTGNTTGGITNFASNKFVLDTSGFTNPLSGGVFSLTQGLSGSNPALFLNFSPVPEPSTYALLGLGALSIAATAWRRRRSSR